MEVDIQEIIAEVGRLHIQVMAQQKVIADLTAKATAEVSTPSASEGKS